MHLDFMGATVPDCSSREAVFKANKTGMIRATLRVHQRLATELLVAVGQNSLDFAKYTVIESFLLVGPTSAFCTTVGIGDSGNWASVIPNAKCVPIARRAYPCQRRHRNL